MAEITRKKQQIFAGGLSASGNIAIYGSKVAGSPAYSSDLDDIQSTRWLSGILGATSTDKAPYVQDLNGIFYTITKQLAYIFQAGIAEWQSQTEYFAGKSVVRYNGVLYIAIANSTNQTPTNTSYWMRLDNEEFNQTYINLTDGYPLGKVLRYGRYKIRSLIANNKNAPTDSNIKISDSEAGTFYWELVDSIAPGTILPFAGSKIPNGWLLCNGASKSATTYPFLFRMIGYTYGGSDDNFLLPDFRNKTFWGGNISEVGTNKAAGLPNIKGDFAYVGSAVTQANKAFSRLSVSSTWEDSHDRSGTNRGISFDANNGVAEGAEGIYKDDCYTVQPPAIQTPFIIKY